MKTKTCLLILWLGLISSLAQAQTLVSNNTPFFAYSTPGFAGQSFTTPNDSTVHVMTSFTWLDASSVPMGAGQLYVFSQEYLGLPTAPALTSGSGFLGVSSTYSGGSYSFVSGISLAPNTEYWGYSATSQQVGRTSADYTGGHFYSTASIGTNFAQEAFNDAAFIVTATAVPEPSTYAALAGVAALGLAVWRRRAQRASST
jgi:hypothetical protein